MFRIVGVSGDTVQIEDSAPRSMIRLFSVDQLVQLFELYEGVPKVDPIPEPKGLNGYPVLEWRCASCETTHEVIFLGESNEKRRYRCPRGHFWEYHSTGKNAGERARLTRFARIARRIDRG